MLKAAGCILAAAWAMFVSTPAFAQVSCNASNRFNFNFATPSPPPNLDYGSSYNWTAQNALGQQVIFSTAFNDYNLSTPVAGGVTMPALTNLINGGGTTRSLVIGGVFTGRTANIMADNRVIVTTFTFPTPIREITLVTHDIDYTHDQYRDWLAVIGRNGANTYVPVLTTPFGQQNSTGPYTHGSSSLKLGPQAAPLATGVQEAVGVGSSGNNSTTGNLTLSFAQPVTQVELRYGNYPYQGGSDNSTGQQAYGISTVSFCPMPALSVAKISAPLATTGENRFAIPGSQIVYTITVINSGGSTVDSNSSSVVDLLPSQMAFLNGTYGGAGMPVLFTANSSGLTLAAANVAYSNNGGATYAYTPTSGVDPNVNAIRVSPQGTMAANSSYSIAFLAQVK